MKKIGSFLFSLYLWAVVGTVTALISTLILVSSPLAFFDRDRRWAHALGGVWGKLLIGLNPFWRVQIRGMKHVRRRQGYVLVANHASLSDIVCLFALGHQFKWLAKKSLFKIPFLGWSMSAMGYIPLERGRHGSIRTSYRQALDWLKRNVSVLIFPEGTRSRSGEMGHFKSGAFRLAIEAGRPILPLVLAGTQDVISKGKAAFGKPGTAYLGILPPVETRGLTIQDEESLRKEVEALMRKELAKRNRILARMAAA